MDNQPYFAILVWGDDGYVRTDFCENCWAQKQEIGSPYSIWQGVFKMPAPAQEEPLKKETAESLLRRLMENEDKSKINVIYILAIMLERKRILVERDIQTRNDGTIIHIYEHRKTGETFLIPDPHLKLDQLESVQQEVIAMLGDNNHKTASGPATV